MLPAHRFKYQIWNQKQDSFDYIALVRQDDISTQHIFLPPPPFLQIWDLQRKVENKLIIRLYLLRFIVAVHEFMSALILSEMRISGGFKEQGICYQLGNNIIIEIICRYINISNKEQHIRTDRTDVGYILHW